MKLKKLMIASILCLLVFFIYLSTVDKKVYYLNLGSSLAKGINSYGVEDYGYADYVKDYLEEKGLLEKMVSFTEEDYRVSDLIRDIKDNKKNEKVTLKNALIKADLVTISIGFEDIYPKISSSDYSYFDESILDMEELFKLVREYCKEDIFFLGYYNPSEEGEEVYTYLNERLSELCKKYQIEYVTLYSIFEENKENFLPNKENIYPSKEGYTTIGYEIVAKIEKNLLQ